MPAPILESPLLNLTVISTLLSRPCLNSQERARLLDVKLHLLINNDITPTTTSTNSNTTTNSNSGTTTNSNSNSNNTNSNDSTNSNPNHNTNVTTTTNIIDKINTNDIPARTYLNAHPHSIHPEPTTRPDQPSVNALSRSIKHLEHQIEIMQVRLELARALLLIGSIVDAQVHLLDIISVSGKVLRRRKRRNVIKSPSGEKKRGDGHDRGGEEGEEGVGEEEKELDDEISSHKVIGLRKEALKEMVAVEEVLGKHALAQRWIGLLKDLEDDNGLG
ncbi:hypothetical protein BCR39DRAFT_542662 [Naematelia encephala]|uniref:Uncharacterized protein n=1 Tax=Naematelia encephala TaxID=71784 RepID=A0A1Y2AUI1_9TREE|nr:hypothetical protein BCR39DRAFT_542662 [Naematelia encephala]